MLAANRTHRKKQMRELIDEVWKPKTKDSKETRNADRNKTREAVRGK
jgi:hypothetical protein